VDDCLNSNPSAFKTRTNEGTENSEPVGDCFFLRSKGKPGGAREYWALIQCKKAGAELSENEEKKTGGGFRALEKGQARRKVPEAKKGWLLKVKPIDTGARLITTNR